jgi:hypothetical protein
MVFAATVAYAQPVTAQFVPGYTDIGPTIGLGGVGSASLAFGGRVGRGIKTLPEFADGILGIQFSVDFWSYTDRGILADFSYKYIPIGATVDYHFVVEDNNKIDPFLGLGLGISIVSCRVSGVDCDASSGLYFIGRAGARYFYRPTMAFYGDVGAGAATLNVGLMFTVND